MNGGSNIVMFGLRNNIIDTGRLTYKNYEGTIVYDYDLRCYYGEIVDGWGEYYGCTLCELYENFIKQVDKYIYWCKTILLYPERKDAWGRKGIKIVKDGELYKCIKLKNNYRRYN